MVYYIDYAGYENKIFVLIIVLFILLVIVGTVFLLVVAKAVTLDKYTYFH
ncbi:MAG: YjcZ family sporulation protein [Nitrososphaeraceae archaeon]